MSLLDKIEAPVRCLVHDNAKYFMDWDRARVPFLHVPYPRAARILMTYSWLLLLVLGGFYLLVPEATTYQVLHPVLVLAVAPICLWLAASLIDSLLTSLFTWVKSLFLAISGHSPRAESRESASASPLSVANRQSSPAIAKGSIRAAVAISSLNWKRGYLRISIVLSFLAIAVPISIVSEDAQYSDMPRIFRQPWFSRYSFTQLSQRADMDSAVVALAKQLVSKTPYPHVSVPWSLYDTVQVYWTKSFGHGASGVDWKVGSCAVAFLLTPLVAFLLLAGTYELLSRALVIVGVVVRLILGVLMWMLRGFKPN